MFDHGAQRRFIGAPRRDNENGFDRSVRLLDVHRELTLTLLARRDRLTLANNSNAGRQLRRRSGRCGGIRRHSWSLGRLSSLTRSHTFGLKSDPGLHNPIVVAISGLSDPETEASLLREGADWFFAKPLRLEQLVEKIRELSVDG